jgi:hypothetical protein
MTVNRRLLGLTVGHLVLGMIASLLAPIALSRSAGLEVVWVVGLGLCQALLLALWAASSTGLAWWGRLAGLIAGVVYLEALFRSIGREAPGFMSTITVMIATAALFVVRALGMRLVRFPDSAHPAPSETDGFRFSIRGLMLVTAAVALLSAGARALREGHDTVLFTVGFAMYFDAVGLVALWAALGLGRPLWRGAAVVALSPVLGVLFAFAARLNPAWVYFVLVMLLYPALLFGSLLVVRSCGYRFVRRAVSSSRSPDERSGSIPLEIRAQRTSPAAHQVADQSLHGAMDAPHA